MTYQRVSGFILVNSAYACPIKFLQKRQPGRIEGILGGDNSEEIRKIFFSKHWMCIGV